ncbi:MAG: tRNA preQ1(34) S-adenosylmethionine ribosyltransferase-isomerase QueA [Chloroflexi bacterium]|nr:tRNA preQ1(34) S-adenosylmethionine ribosyltransferase-isomerase QueA [Chloroflexota bacterium]MCC6891245.1 tRNA preQ1(34) S-adenosylmethionine ribosyltransferase-isomerase QueA [Anaerolineae bacterium]
MNLTDFDYDLPESFIAQEPLEPRDSSKLMRLNRQTGAISHHIFRDILDFINPGDALIMNTTRVIPARLFASKATSGGKVEILLLRQLDDIRWHVLAGGRKVLPDVELHFAGADVTARVEEVLQGSERIIEFSQPVNNLLVQLGEMPLPPYIHHRLQDAERYQTVYSRQEGSAAAPTAGLHFTPELLLKLRDKGVKIASCLLHVGLDTFQPVKVDRIEDHHMHSERASLSAADAQIINEAKLAGGRIITVGTTSTRTIETAAILSAGGDPAHPEAIGDICAWRPVTAFESDTNLFIYPGYKWRVVDALITNFHLPKSTLLMMMSSFAGRENMLHAYETAKQNNYRFFSFGDAMFIS